MTTTTKTTTTPSKFQPGDKIRITDERYSDWVGQEGVVLSINDDGVEYRITKAAPTELGPRLNTVGNISSNHEDQLTVIEAAKPAEDAVEHPSHYGGGDNPYEVIKVAEAWGFDKDAYLFNVLKYIARSDKKSASLQDHKKARFYLDRKIERLEDGLA